MPEIKAVRLVIVLWVVTALVGCIKQWYLGIEHWDTDGLTFCLGKGSRCDAHGVQLRLVWISQVERDGLTKKTIWQIQNVADAQGEATLKKLKYGEVPPGWKEQIKAQNLLPNVYYTINDEYYFMRDTNFRHSMLTRDSFFSLSRDNRTQ